MARGSTFWTNEDGELTGKGIAFLSFLIILVLFVGCNLMFGSWYTVEQGERGIVTRNGALLYIAEPGLHFKFPFIDGVREISVRNEKKEYDKLAGYSKDLQTAELRVSVNYKVDPTKVGFVFKEYGVDSYVDKALDPQVYKSVKEIFGRYTAAEVVSKREQLNSEIQAAINIMMQNTGLIVETVQLENVDFSDTYEAAIEAAAQAEADVKKVRQQLERDKIEAEKNAALAKGKADAEVERARGMKAVADAEAYAIQKRGDALRENPKLVEMTLAEKWNGVLPTSMVPGQSVPFLNVK